ncbi:sn-glycerol-3-phosphate import ATP-binding protein UgpC [compost metagenome]
MVLRLDDGLDVPLGAAKVPEQWLGRELVVGVRPEHLQPATGNASFRARIEGLEPVGNEIFVNLRHGEQALVIRVAPQALPALGQELAVGVVSVALHFFDPITGKRISA